MKKSIVLFICLCTGLTLKAMKKTKMTLKIKSWAIEVYTLNSLPEENEKRIEVFSVTIEQLNEFNETSNECYFKSLAGFEYYTPIAVLCPEHIIQSLEPLEKEKDIQNNDDLNSLFKKLRKSLPYYDGQTQLKLFDSKLKIIHAYRCKEKIKLKECSSCSNERNLIKKLRKFYEQNNCHKKLTQYLVKFAMLFDEEGFSFQQKTNRKNLEKILRNPLQNYHNNKIRALKNKEEQQLLQSNKWREDRHNNYLVRDGRII